MENIEGEILSATFSSPFSPDMPSKVAIRPIENGLYQYSKYYKDKVFHENREKIDWDRLNNYKQGLIYTSVADYHLLKNKKGKTTLLKKPPTKTPTTPHHNRIKRSLISEEAPFLKSLGIQKNKFRQINRFLELIEDILPHLPKEKLRVVDLASGKGYLTVALYHFLKDRGYTVHLTGVERRQELASFCKEQENGPEFVAKKITDYHPEGTVDMVLALHACDTATDDALEKGISWKAKAILLAPCCQQEYLKKITSEVLAGLFQFGILKERFSSILTDGMRALKLQAAGYHTQVLEFIDSEHTKKNLMIRAVFGNSEQAKEQAKEHIKKLQPLVSPA